MYEYKVLHLFCGIGGYALGMQQAVEEYRGMVGQFRTLAGIDCDPDACADFEALTGAPAVQMDLFSREDYVLFHGKEPPETWQEATSNDLWEATGLELPDVVCLSPPCKGFSGLLPSQKAASEKYQALNRLAVRSMELTLEAFEASLPAFIMIENVPRITSRGELLLKQVKRLLGRHGYVFHEGNHDCGELGGLGQHRRRYLLIARLPDRVPQFVYLPVKQRVKSIGEVIGPLPLPDDPKMGPMHRLPRLQWKTCVRLALIPAGGDWRDLEKIAPEQYRLVHVPRSGAFGVQDWDKAGGVVTSADGPNNSTVSVADPRVPFNNIFRVNKWDETPGAITSGNGQTGTLVADPRLDHVPREGVYRVQEWGKPSTTVTGAARVNTSNGAACIADPRLSERDNRHPSVYKVVKFDDPAPCVTGTRFGSGAPAIADPRLPEKDVRFHNKYQLLGWNEPASTVTGTADIQAGAQSIADPRTGFKEGTHHVIYQVGQWDNPANTVTGATRPAGGAISVADPRMGCKARNGTMGVQTWDEPGKTVIGAGDIHAGSAAVADPRIDIIGGGNCDTARDREPILQSLRAQTKMLETMPDSPKRIVAPKDHDRPDPPPIIIALDGTWHRPLTTLELAALQGFPLTMPDGRPLLLVGKSDAKWRERIGNAVPPPAAKAFGGVVLRALLLSQVDGFELSETEIWVKPWQRRKTDRIEAAVGTLGVRQCSGLECLSASVSPPR